MNRRDPQNKIALFKGKKIRRHWDEKREKWYFSMVDVVAVLSGSVDPLAYWRKLKERKFGIDHARSLILASAVFWLFVFGIGEI